MRERETLQQQQEGLLESMSQLQEELENATQQPTPRQATPAPQSSPPPPPSSPNISKLLRDQKEAMQAQHEATLTVGWHRRDSWERYPGKLRAAAPVCWWL